MSRTISALVEAESIKAAVQPVFFIEMDFSGGFVRLWSGYGSFTWNGQTWLGAGHLLEIDPMSETVDFVANGAAVRLNGIPSAMLAVALGENYQGRPATIYLGFLDSSNVIIADPLQLYKASMDIMEIDEGGETASISIRIESQAISLKRSKEWRYTHEDQLIDYPGDLGFEYVAGLQDKALIWKPFDPSTIVQAGLGVIHL